MSDSFAKRSNDIATGEWTFFGQQTFDLAGHTTHPGRKEAEDGWFQRIGRYWLEGVNKPGLDGRDNMPWSAAFISWVMKTAGAGTRFRYDPQHSVYISKGIRDRLHNRQSAGYWTWRLNELKPQVGDLACWSRQAGIDYDHQNGGFYQGHSDLIVEVASQQVKVIGGNVGNSVTKRILALNQQGFLRPVTVNGETLFSLMQNRIV